MGGTLTKSAGKRVPNFMVQVLMDEVPIASIDIIKLYYREGEMTQRVTRVANHREGRRSWCINWQDDEYRAEEAALWYARVLQVPTKRWDGQKLIRERAWSSPIWSLHK